MYKPKKDSKFVLQLTPNRTDSILNFKWKISTMVERDSDVAYPLHLIFMVTTLHDFLNNNINRVTYDKGNQGLNIIKRVYENLTINYTQQELEEYQDFLKNLTNNLIDEIDDYCNLDDILDG